MKPDQPNMTQREKKAYAQGYRNGLKACLTPEQNPYELYTILHGAFEEGWRDARLSS